jgi:hypothetical protein
MQQWPSCASTAFGLAAIGTDRAAATTSSFTVSGLAAVRTDRATVAASSFVVSGLTARAATAAATQSDANNAFPLIVYG